MIELGSGLGNHGFRGTMEVMAGRRRGRAVVKAGNDAAGHAHSSCLMAPQLTSSLAAVAALCMPVAAAHMSTAATVSVRWHTDSPTWLDQAL